MISPKGSLAEFVEATKNLDHKSIIVAARREKRDAEGRKLGRYIEALNGVAWLLETGSRPSGVHPWEFVEMRPIIEALVERRELKPEALAIFGAEHH